MPIIFHNKDSVFFVGGTGTKTGLATAGGCTQAFWDSSQNLDDVMKNNGQPQGYDADAVVTDNGSGKVRMTGDASNFATCSVGLVAYLSFPPPGNGGYSNGRYEVIDVDSAGDWIDIDLTYDPTYQSSCDVTVGGAFDTAQNAWNNTDATHSYSVTIHSNKSQSHSNGDFTATWNLGTAGGTLTNTNRPFKRFVGFTTQPEDGGQIILDGEDDAAFSPNGGIKLDSAIECIIFENVIVKRAYVNWNAANSGIAAARFINCEGNNGHTGWRLQYGANFVLINCKADGNTYYGFDLVYISGLLAHFFINCIASNNGREGFRNAGGRFGGLLLGCIAHGNGKGGTPYDGFLIKVNTGTEVVRNCVAYDNGKHGFEFGYYDAIAINCIAKDNGQWGFYADMGAVRLMAPHVAYCCAHNNSSGQFSLPGALPAIHSIEEDPQFVDAANGDFRPRNPAVLRGGKPDISGNPTQMGAILQKYQFGDRERIVNMARLRIIR